ncbi:MAG TPA: class I SAM-dependent methyltransferase [Thermoleophilaceae bacterium]|jgi:predicted O-methyltransferase YrrM
MNADRLRVAAELLARSRSHDAAQSDRLLRFRNVEPETAGLLGVLIRATRAQRILELGTSNGYSTIWLADAAEATGGAVTSVEIDPERTAMAKASLAKAGLEVELHTEDAADALRSSPDGAWDFVFLDAERPAYAGYWPDLLRVLRRDGGTVAIDNVLSHPDQVAAVTELIEAEPTVTSALVPIGAGLRLAVRYCR